MNTTGGTGRGVRDSARSSPAPRARRRYFARFRFDNRPFFTLTWVFLPGTWPKPIQPVDG
jgi:hypothetical protein